ncbi:hypothetical protein [Chitinophaga arvensicola]|uniref:DUF2214 domain-containing protein n=1 Tax=Chitinophaga arvensicola TaxID=29529 RepID=A0A1I0SA49_9BACT|nr:hypothetical protein [Chitinophaga arvensicola]SEW53034.1 hypothetical protein SAMN04488122_5307 [Chitinophaga arvensicola]
MSTQVILQGFVVLHLIGLLLFAGTSVADFAGYRQFWKQYSLDKSKAAVMLQTVGGFHILMRIGIGLIILSGIGLMYMTHGVFGEQLWFRVKFGLVILIILNTFLYGRRQKILLEKSIAGPETGIQKIKENIRLFHIVQLLIVFIILLLSVFKFN